MYWSRFSKKGAAAMNVRPRHITALLTALMPALPAGASDRLLIITPSEFTGQLAPLVRFKEASGRTTFVETLDNVYGTYFGDDEPEQVKWCIVDYEQNENVDMVLLVGDVDKFPVRWTFWGNENQAEFHPTDLYYADLYADGTTNFETWDRNNNDLYSEIEFAPDEYINNDAIDYLPDVSVGRIAASTAGEVTAYVSKVIAYEMQTLPTDAWFQTVELYTGAWRTEHNARSDEIESMLTPYGFTSIKRYTDWSGPDPVLPPNMPDDLVADFNAGLGFASYMGHGLSTCWGCLGFCIDTLSQVANPHMFPVASGAACNTGMFAWHAGPFPYVDIDGIEHCGYKNGEALDPGPYPHPDFPRPDPLQSGFIDCPGGGYCEARDFDMACIGEALQFGNPPGLSGAIVYLGERGAGQYTADEAVKYFYEGYASLGYRTIGDMWEYMIWRYYQEFDLGNSHNWYYTPDDWGWGFVFDEARKFIVFGDPSLRVGGAFTRTRSGSAWDGNGGPWSQYNRYRVVGDVNVPAGQSLTIEAQAAVLFEPGRKVVGQGTNSTEGVQVTAFLAQPVCLMSLDVDPEVGEVVRGMVIRGDLRAYNGGEIKVH
jgi:hypothetical protein